MKLVVDTNIIISALIKDGINRKILFSPFIDFITPDYSLEEILKYERVICKKANLDHNGFKKILNIIFGKISIIPKREYLDKLNRAKTMIKDLDDTPFIALNLATKADGIWSNDEHFKTRKDLMIFRTKELALIFKPK
jgi:predicted nucleic acid-binding protein